MDHLGLYKDEQGLWHTRETDSDYFHAVAAWQTQLVELVDECLKAKLRLDGAERALTEHYAKRPALPLVTVGEPTLLGTKTKT